MSPRIAYWTSSFESGMEAIANEVALLRQRYPSSVAWGLSHRHWLLLSRRRGYCLHPRLHLLFRAAVRLLEPAFQLNHVFGSLGDWFYLQGQRRRPTLLTVAVDAKPVDKALLDRVDCFVVEHPGGKSALEQLGIDGRRLRLILPPVDLAAFTPAPPPDGPFTILFASSPDDADWLEARGVPLILDAARLQPQMRFRLLWRPWGNSLPRVRRWLAEGELANVELLTGRRQDMAGQYQNAHVTIAPFTDARRCKPAPNSLIESLACGRPALLTETVGLADIIRSAGAGIVSAPSGEALAESLARLQADWPTYAANARRLAEERFSAERFLHSYHQLYAEMLGK